MKPSVKSCKYTKVGMYITNLDLDKVPNELYAIALLLKRLHRRHLLTEQLCFEAGLVAMSFTPHIEIEASK